VETVFGKIGRSRTATDPAPIGMVETTIMLKPKKEWRKGMTWDKLIDEMDEKLQYPGMPNIWWMPIQTRTEMLATGIRSPLGIQLFGDNLSEIEKAAVQIEKAVQEIPGTRSAFAERSTGGFFIDFKIKRENAARYGLSVKDINQFVQTAIGGMNVGETVEGRRRFPIQVRYAREWRDDPEKLSQLLISTPTGAEIPLSSVAEISFVNGPPMIRSEDGKLVGFVFVDPGSRAVADYVKEAKRVVSEKVKLPAGIRVGWAGQFKYFERAKARLKLILPITLVVVFLLLFLNTRSLVQTGVLLLTVPFSLVGSIWLLFFLNYNMSVAVWVGLIALLGIAVETGVIMLLYLNLSHDRWEKEGRLKTFGDLVDSIVEGSAMRIRPKVMAVNKRGIGKIKRDKFFIVGKKSF